MRILDLMLIICLIGLVLTAFINKRNYEFLIDELKKGQPEILCNKQGLDHKTSVYQVKKKQIIIWCE